jgi:hypothetical protein
MTRPQVLFLLLCLAVTPLFAAGCAEIVEIRSYPGGAKALIDGRVVGTTPATAAIPRDQVGLPHTWRVEYRNCDYAEGQLHTGIAGGRIVGYIFTAGFFALFRGPYYYPEVDAILTGGDCEGSQARPAAPQQPGILIQNVVGERSSATTGTVEASKTQKLSERLTTLRDLYNRKLISQEVYDQEMQKAVRESQ